MEVMRAMGIGGDLAILALDLIPQKVGIDGDVVLCSNAHLRLPGWWDATTLRSLQMQPRQLLIAEKMLRWLEPARLIEGADVEMRLGRQLDSLAGQRGAAGSGRSRASCREKT